MQGWVHGLGRADQGRPLGERSGVRLAGHLIRISPLGPQRNVSITRAAQAAAAFSLSSPGSPPPAAPSRRAGTLCKCNLSGPRPRREAARRCQERGGARRWKAARSSAADRRPVPRRPQARSLRRLCALAARSLFVPSRPASLGAGPLHHACSDSRLFPFPSPPSCQMAVCSLPFLPLETRE